MTTKITPLPYGDAEGSYTVHTHWGGAGHKTTMTGTTTVSDPWVGIPPYARDSSYLYPTDAPTARFSPEQEKQLRKQVETFKESKKEMVNSPKHYQIFPEYEVRDICRVMSERMGKNGYSHFFATDYVQLLQYLLRFDEKNGKEDLEKAQYYLKKMIESL